MFGSSDPVAKLTQRYEKKMKEARDIQRGGDIKRYALAVAEAEDLAGQIQALREGRSPE